MALSKYRTMDPGMLYSLDIDEQAFPEHMLDKGVGYDAEIRQFR